jgi:hypothetical protein
MTVLLTGCGRDHGAPDEARRAPEHAAGPLAGTEPIGPSGTAWDAAQATPPAPTDPPAVELGTRPASITLEHIVAADATIAFMVELAATIDAHPNRCDQLAAALSPMMEKAKVALEPARKAEAELANDPAAVDWMKRYVDHGTGPAMRRVAEGLDRCKDHEGAKSALSSLLTGS